MYEGCAATMKMVQMTLQEGYFDEKIHPCKVIVYQPEEESIYLLSEEMELPGFSLDGIYECRMETPDGTLSCLGNIRERYWSQSGKVLGFQIKNGFYKNLVN